MIDFVQEAKRTRDIIRQAIVDELKRSQGALTEDLRGLLAADAHATEVYTMAIHQMNAERAA